MFPVIKVFFSFSIYLLRYSDLNDPIRIDNDSSKDFGGCAC